MRLLIKLTIFIIFLANTPYAHSESMSQETHTLVINKLEIALKKLSTPSRAAVMQRLGDLYSERARLKAIEEYKNNCKRCTAAKSDRKKALYYYEKIAKGQRLNGNLIVQMAHLYSLIGQAEKSTRLYKKVALNPKKFPSELLRKAYTNLGTISYQEGNYKTALNQLSKALKYPQNYRAGFIKYHIAWSYLNLGKNTQAKNTLVSILKNPKYLVTDESGKVDDDFRNQISRDLATFYARSSVRDAEINSLFKLSPEKTRVANLKHLASEVERLGGTRTAIKVWKAYQRLNPDKLAAMESLVHIAQLQLTLGHEKSTLSTVRQLEKSWDPKVCKETCEELRLRFRSLITGWHKNKKIRPSKNLLNAYKSFTVIFPKDLEMHYWAAQLSMDLRHFNTAIEYFNKSSFLSSEKLADKKLKKRKSISKMRTGSFMGAIDAAEQTNKPKTKLAAYKHYLKYKPDGRKAADIKYQIAHTHYGLKAYKVSAPQFKAIALNKKQGSKSIRKKAADLSLDSLALLKDNLRLSAWATEFKILFPKHNKEFTKIARKAITTQVALVANSKKSTTRELKKQLAQLNTVSLYGATYEERVAHYRNKIIIAERINDFTTSVRSTNSLLSLPKLNKTDKTFAIAKRIWLAELLLDFKTAYRLAKNREPLNKASESRLLHLAVLAELSGKNPSIYYNKFIKKTPSVRRANEIRARLVLRSSKPWTTLLSLQDKLNKTPDILAETSLIVFSKYRNFSGAKKILKNKKVKRYAAGKQLYRLVNYSDLYDIARRLKSHKIRTYNQVQLQRTLGQRLNLMSVADKLASEAIAQKDWVLQLSYLTVIERANLRLHDEILKLPAPKNLTKVQLAQYKTLVSKQAAPYKRRALQVKSRLNAFWKNNKNLDFYLTKYTKSPIELRRVHKKDIQVLYDFSAKNSRSKISSALNKSFSIPQRKEILVAKKKLIKSPTNIKKLKNLKNLTEKKGQRIMVSFLNTRLKNQIKRTK